MDSKRTLKKRSQASRAVDEESKLQGGSSTRSNHQLHGASEGTVNGFDQSRSGSNDLSDDADILEISAPEKKVGASAKVSERKKGVAKEMKKKRYRRKENEADCVVIPMDKQKSKDTITISVSESDEEQKSTEVGDKVKEKIDVESGHEERKRAIKKGKEKVESVAAEASNGTAKKSGSIPRKCKKVKNSRKENVPVPCVAWRTRSFRNQDSKRVNYTQFFEVKDHSNSYRATYISDSDPVSDSDSDLGLPEMEESESSSDSDACSDSFTRPGLLESDEGAELRESKKRGKGKSVTRNPVRAFGKDKTSNKEATEKDVDEAANDPSFSEDSEEVPILERKNKTRRRMHGEGCSRAQPLDKENCASSVELLTSSSDEENEKVKKVAKKMRCEKEQRFEKEKRVGGSKRPKKKQEKQPTKNDLLDYLMTMMDLEADEGLADSELEGHRNSPQELPLVFDWSDNEPAVEKSDFDQFVDEAWQDFDSALAFEEVGTYNPDQEKERDAAYNVANNYCADGQHDMYLDEQIGYLCRKCSYVEAEIRHIMPLFAPKGRNAPVGPSKISACNLLNYDDLSQRNEMYEQCEPSCPKTGTVWDLIPGVIDNMYPHQREAFEFMWRNLAGGIELGDLNTQAAQSDNLGGCVISHAPGTGKTRLAIVFIQSYVKAFPNCNPVVFAPASIMQTWENEFKKWDFDIPFHNMNSEDFTGKEDTRILDLTNGETRSMQLARTVKLCSWVKRSSVLGMSYDLFRDYVLGKSSADSKEREVLLTKPGLIVLDEGHTPRNDRSRLWKAFNEVKTEKRIILSGTPFQNTFAELRNTLCLVRPRFAQRFAVPTEKPDREVKKKKLIKDIWSKPTKNVTDENADEVRTVLKPFVHVHQGDILKSLPGLRECVIMLNPEQVQKEAIQNLGLVKNSGTFDSEYKTSIASIHPFLLTSINKITDRELSLLNMDLLKKLQDDPYSGVKTKFVVEFVRLLMSDPKKERVLIFSQYIEPLNLIKEQLMKMFHWTEGSEVLHIFGKIQNNERQRFINSFNNMSNKARVLLASTRACSEGISLTGASRVIMLDVVWNPAVGKQAISRAFRIGQERFVYTYNLITAGTGEMEKYDVQGKKEKLSKLVFSAEAEAGGTGFTHGFIEEDGDARLLVAEDQVLEKLTSNDKLKGMFAKIYYNKSDDLLERLG